MREEIKQVEKELEELQGKLVTESRKFPNNTHPAVPRSIVFSLLSHFYVDGEPNQVALIGEKPKFDFSPKPHWEIGQMWDLFDWEKGAEVASAGYYFSKVSWAIAVLIFSE